MLKAIAAKVTPNRGYAPPSWSFDRSCGNSTGYSLPASSFSAPAFHGSFAPRGGFSTLSFHSGFSAGPSFRGGGGFPGGRGKR